MNPQAPLTPTGVPLFGKLLSGTLPVAGAHIYLFAAAQTGYGASSASLLVQAPTINTDPVGNYVLTAADGSFTIPGFYSCAASDQIYVYAQGGDSGQGENAAATDLAAVGGCPAIGVGVAPMIIDEVTTIAAAFALAGFATDPLHVSSSGSPLALTGVSTAFLNAAHLAPLSTGLAPVTLPSGRATVPQRTINTLANILFACVHSTGPGSIPCVRLFGSTANIGGAPMDTASGALAIAHSPASSVSALYALQPVSPPFSPSLTSPPNDWSLGLVFTGGGLTEVDSVAIDAAGDLWAVNYNSTAVTKISHAGDFLSGSAGYQAGLFAAGGIALDVAGNAWIVDGAGALGTAASIVELSSSGSVLTPTSGLTANGSLRSPSGLALDAANHLWVSNTGSSNLIELSTAGQVLSGSNGFAGGGVTSPGYLVIDAAQHVWVTDLAFSISEFANSGAPLSGTAGYTGNGFYGADGMAVDSQQNIWAVNAGGYAYVAKFSPSGALLSGLGFTGGGIVNSTNYGGGCCIAIDGANHAWIPLETGTTVVELANDGTVLSGPAGYGGGLAQGPLTLAIDGSGDVWVSNYVVAGRNTYTDQVTEMIGIATPVVTPIQAGVIGNSLGSRP